ncbi:MAG: type II toxin-antitoxin system RelE/ParE family toxin [Oscillospiraceae bacterium]|nr:type II toxin-antitoxin system RelE/ParE family toxin [Oscillospiraceae bacterium]
MDRLFLHTEVFNRTWVGMECNDDDLSELQKAICVDPQKPRVIQGTGGVRKIRVALPGRGKSGGARVMYADFPSKGMTALLYAYPKSEKENITAEEKKILKAMVEQINKNWGNQK